jgi:hypothetical protein
VVEFDDGGSAALLPPAGAPLLPRRVREALGDSFSMSEANKNRLQTFEFSGTRPREDL